VAKLACSFPHDRFGSITSTAAGAFAKPQVLDSIFDPAITTSATRGYYVVYLFHV